MGERAPAVGAVSMETLRSIHGCGSKVALRVVSPLETAAMVPASPAASHLTARPVLRGLARALGPLLPAEAPPLLPFALLAVPLLGRAVGQPAVRVAPGRQAPDWMALESVLLAALPELHDALAAARPAVVEALAPVLDNALEKLPSGGGHLSWLHQYLGEAEAKAAIGASLQRGTKLEQERLLSATQFFTPPFMVDWLLARGAAVVRAQGGAVASVLDPACGGGNFLVHTLAAGRTDAPGDIGHRHAASRPRTTGYELDPLLARVAALELLLAQAASLRALPAAAPGVQAGQPGDERGFLEPAVAAQVVDAARGDGPLLLATNPPFLGRRLLSPPLREWLKHMLPVAGQDLCVAFMVRALEALQPGDAAAFVHQSAWMHLSTFRAFRRWLFTHFELVWCADLGPNAFADLSGEKTSVALSVLCRRRATAAPTTFIRLVDLSGAALEAALVDPPPERVYTLSPARMAALVDGGLAYHQPPALRHRMADHPTVGDFANPMQGTSTGDNRRFVRFAWAVDPADSDWVPVSKGGGFCRWAGLNRYRVRWGPNAVHIRANPGSALRNLGAMDRTQLVYSDTGSRGLNVRLLEPGQVFIASGPGIEVRQGAPLAVMAWLNSRLATCLLRAMTPKLTVAAGYIRRLPLPEAAVRDPVLVQLATEAVAAKRALLADRLGDDEHHLAHPMPDGLTQACADRFARMVAHEWACLQIQARIEARVADLFGLDAAMAAYVEDEVGRPALLRGADAPMPLDALLDAQITGSLDAAGAYRGRRGRTRMGREGIVETVLLEARCDAKILRTRLRQGLGGLPRTQALLAHDLRHRVVLHALGYRGSQAWAPVALGLEEVARALVVAGAADSAADARGWITADLARVHAGAFHRCPFLEVTGERVALVRL